MDNLDGKEGKWMQNFGSRGCYKLAIKLWSLNNKLDKGQRGHSLLTGFDNASEMDWIHPVYVCLPSCKGRYSYVDQVVEDHKKWGRPRNI